MEIPTETKNLIQKRIGEIRQQYPEAQAACLPALYVAQEHLNYVSDDVLDLIADTLTLPSAFVQGVATFYTMYNKRKVGRYHLQLCTNVSCMLEGAEPLLAKLEKHLGIKAGETTSDGVFTLDEVECLAACGTGPVLQINDKYHESMDLEKATALLDKLKDKSDTRELATPNADPSKPGATPAAKPAAKPEAKPEAKTAAKPEAKPAAKPEAKPAPKAEVKPLAKPTVKPLAKPEVKPLAKPEVKPLAKPESKPESKIESKPESKTEAKTESKTEAKSDDDKDE